MDDARDFRSGDCLCGAVRLAATVKTHETGACHCAVGRKWSGGVFMAVGCKDIAIGDDATLGVGPSSNGGERVVCRTCATSLFWRMRDGSAAVANLQSFDDPQTFVFTSQIFVDETSLNDAFANQTQMMTGAAFAAAMSGREA